MKGGECYVWILVIRLKGKVGQVRLSRREKDVMDHGLHQQCPLGGFDEQLLTL